MMGYKKLSSMIQAATLNTPLQLHPDIKIDCCKQGKNNPLIYGNQYDDVLLTGLSQDQLFDLISDSFVLCITTNNFTKALELFNDTRISKEQQAELTKLMVNDKPLIGYLVSRDAWNAEQRQSQTTLLNTFLDLEPELVNVKYRHAATGENKPLILQTDNLEYIRILLAHDAFDAAIIKPALQHIAQRSYTFFYTDYTSRTEKISKPAQNIIQMIIEKYPDQIESFYTDMEKATYRNTQKIAALKKCFNEQLPAGHSLKEKLQEVSATPPPKRFSIATIEDVEEDDNAPVSPPLIDPSAKPHTDTTPKPSTPAPKPTSSEAEAPKETFTEPENESEANHENITPKADTHPKPSTNVGENPNSTTPNEPTTPQPQNSSPHTSAGPELPINGSTGTAGENKATSATNPTHTENQPTEMNIIKPIAGIAATLIACKLIYYYYKKSNQTFLHRWIQKMKNFFTDVEEDDEKKQEACLLKTLVPQE
jgi:hypothetical protein